MKQGAEQIGGMSFIIQVDGMPTNANGLAYWKLDWKYFIKYIFSKNKGE